MSKPTSEILIRAVRADDAPAITLMRGLAGVRYGTLMLPFPTEETTRKAIETLPTGDVYVVAEFGGTVVGFAMLRRQSGRRNHIGELVIAVHDDHRGKRVGTALFAALIEAADRWLGLLRLELGVNCDNAPALALYRRFGFFIEGRRIGGAFRDGEYIDDFLMARLSGHLASRAPCADAAPAVSGGIATGAPP